MATTIRDVAKKSGYSITTVSRALNGYDDVSEETREKILQVAKELNYYPNRIAQNLVTKRFNTLGMFILERMTFQQPFIFEVVSGVVDEATKEDFDLLLFGTQSLRSGMKPHQMCTQRGVGGAIIMGLRLHDPIIQVMEESGFPTVLIDIPIKGKRATFVASDNQLGSLQAINHLVNLGHRHIGFINGHLEAWVSLERLKGYKKGIEEHSLPWKSEYIFQGDFSKESGKKGARILMTQNPELTAIFVASDLMATGVIEELTLMGYKIPDDISVIGFDDLDFASHIKPTLSTIRQDKYQLGIEAARKIIAMIKNENYLPEQHFLKTTLISRESTGPVRIE
ncbi:hypothetical protein BBF96_14290 [Anoxybacter fermentans]|uniref:HTH lacI-type domain-containing protein n=1 Tax=Anoxybacter fermentans TaxID=1323375 RepID=A0A3Q9HSC4_9FIRM|nr:LacI family DNA-binding transcriptional regulator [Anoxybacter fermentans]AZR74454.1 hypothetical protein BBF96_14290 [Anoxybacter fermentans]